MPAGFRGLTQQVIDTHELTAAACTSYDKGLLLRALAADPTVNKLGDAKAVMEDLLKAERDILRPEWYGYRSCVGCRVAQAAPAVDTHLMARPGAGTISPLVYMCVVMFLVGMQMAEVGAVLGRLARELLLSDSQQGLLVASRFIGGTICGILVWLLAAGRNIKLVLAMCLSVVVLTGPLLLVNSYAGALLVSLLRGAVVGSIIPLSGIFAAIQTSRPVSTVTSFVNAAVSAGSVTLSGAALWFSSIQGLAWQFYWLPPTIGALVSLGLLPIVSFPRSPVPTRPAARGFRRVVALLRQTPWSLATVGFLVVGSEAIFLGLIPARSALVSDSGGDGELFALVLMFGVLVGRLAATRVFLRVATTKVFYASAASLVMVSLLWALLPQVSIAWVFLMGLSTAALFPALVSFIAHVRPSVAEAGIAAAGWNGGVGGTVVPAVIGLLLQAGLSNSLTALLGVAPLLLGVVVIAAHNHGPKGVNCHEP